jgi:hypothetical protein
MADDKAFTKQLNRLRAELKPLGDQHKEWKKTAPIMQDLIRRAYNFGMQQWELVELTGYARDNIRLLCMPDDQREELRSRRRKGVDRVAQAALEHNPKLVAQMERTAADPSTRVKRGRPKREPG